MRKRTNQLIGAAQYMLMILMATGVHAERISLSGKGPSDAIEWDFHCSSGRRSGEWTKIPVPSNWEQHGFGGLWASEGYFGSWQNGFHGSEGMEKQSGAPRL